MITGASIKGGQAPSTDFALSFGAVIVKMIDLSKTESRDFFGIILDQENSQKLHLLPCVHIDGFGIGP